MADRWLVGIHPTGDSGVVVGLFSSRQTAEAKAEALEREAVRQGFDVETQVFGLTAATRPSKRILRDLQGDF